MNMTFLPTPAFDSICVPATITRNLRYTVLENDLSYFQLTYLVDVQGDCPESMRERFKPTSLQGFARLLAIKDFIDGSAPSIETLPSMSLVPPGFLEHARTNGFPSAVEKYAKVLERHRGEGPLQSAQVDLDTIVTIDAGDHMLFDRFGQHLPVAISFDYMNGLMANGAYKLDVARDILLKDPRVSPLAHNREQCRPGRDLKIEILEVPYYNNDSGTCKFLSFRFAPTTSDMRDIMDKAKSYGTAYPTGERYRAMFDLDTLGLRAGGAAKFDGYYKSEAYVANSSDLDSNDD